MQRRTLSLALLAALAAPVQAQDPAVPDGSEAERRQLDTIVVQAEIAYRDRSETTAPVLSYDLDCFQRF